MSQILKGDVDKFYCQLRRHCPVPPNGPVQDLNHVRAIAEYYGKLDPAERLLLLAWAKKEESGIGMIPAALSGVPLIGLLFAPLIQEPIKHLPPWTWIGIWAISAVAFTAGIYIHQRQKAYTTLHIAILERLCQAGEKAETDTGRSGSAQGASAAPF